MQPIPIDVKAGETYWWCRCGKSARQPFCDGSHKGGRLAPLKYIPTESKTVWFCACKRTRSQPLCDGSHKAVDAPPCAD